MVDKLQLAPRASDTWAERSIMGAIEDQHHWYGYDRCMELGRAAPTVVSDLLQLREAVDGLLERTVADHRAAGLSWSTIGLLLGVSKQAAQKRYGRPSNGS